MPREGQPAAIRCCLIPENFLVAHFSPHNDSLAPLVVVATIGADKEVVFAAGERLGAVAEASIRLALWCGFLRDNVGSSVREAAANISVESIFKRESLRARRGGRRGQNVAEEAGVGLASRHRGRA